MTKADFTKEIARHLDIPLRAARVVLDAILDGMVRALHNGDRIEIRGFGTFSTRTRKPRKARNPTTGAGVNVPSKRIPSFRASAELKALVNSSDQNNQPVSAKEALQKHAGV
jgi:integration host factor subunit beta